MVELLVSIAIVVVLMTGIATVFRITGDTIGVGQASSAMNRDARAAQAVFAQDFQGAATDGPWIFIRSGRQNAFLNAKDAASDRDKLSYTYDVDNDGIEGDKTKPGEYEPVAIYNIRNHRVDRCSFFARGQYERQTGDDGTFASQTTSREALVRYQLMRQSGTNLAGATLWYDPGSNSPYNKDNLYASQWILGRSALLLLATPPTNQNYFDRPLPEGEFDKIPTGAGYYKPDPVDIATGSTSLGAPSYALRTNRYDIAQTDIAGYSRILARHALGGIYSGTRSNGQPMTYDFNRVVKWWSDGNSFGTVDQPMYAYPYKRPITSESVSQAHPIFLQGVSQFIVEYAGDFLSQDPITGNVIDATYIVENGGGVIQTQPMTHQGVTDGVVDFYIDGNGYKQIRWYGLPRDTNGDNKIPVSKTDLSTMPDVVPLRDVIRTRFPTATRAPNERVLPPYPPASGGNLGDYAQGPGAMPPDDSDYICAWSKDDRLYGLVGDQNVQTASGNDRNIGGTPVPPAPKPQLIRITITLVDPNGSVPDGQTYQYVYKLP